MKIYKYKDYCAYVAAQERANKRKIKNVWVNETTIKTIVDRNVGAQQILCHGTRNGTEQRWFKKYLPDATVIGTEISTTALQFPNTEQHDFHEEREDWVGRFDIVYSNSWDHSYDPEKSLSTWRNQLTDCGKMYIEVALDPQNNKSRESDPLEISHEEIVELVQHINMKITDILRTTGSEHQHPCFVYEIVRQESLCGASNS
jgi:hypothetical protein